MDKEQLFLEGHKALIQAFRLIHTPALYIPRTNRIDIQEIEGFNSGQIVQGNLPVGKGFEIIHSIAKENINTIVKTFCESHLRLK